MASAQVLPPAVWLRVAQWRAVAEQRVGQVLAPAQPVRALVPEQAAASPPPERASSPLVAEVLPRAVQASVSLHRPIVAGSPAPALALLRVAAAARRAEPASQLASLVAAVAAVAQVPAPVAPRCALPVLAPASPLLAASA